MKKIICVLCIIFVCTSTYVFAKTKQIISSKNEYGGKTTLVTFSSNDESYKQGAEKDIVYYGNNRKIAKVESSFTKESARKTGIAKTITYFDKNENMVKTENFSTDELIKNKGVAKTIIYYDSNGNRVKAELYDTNGKIILTK